MASRQTKLAIVTDSIYPYNKGGKEVRIHELSTRLARQGFDVHIYTMKWWGGSKLTRTENGVKLHAISKLYPLYAGERRSIKEGILFGVACFRLIREDFDVVDVDHMPYFPLFSVRIVAWLKGKPMIGTWHEVWGKAYWREYLGAAGIIGSAMEQMTVRLPSKIVGVSDLTVGRLDSELGARMPLFTVVNGIDLATIKATRPSRRRSDIMYAGRLLEHKNVDVLLRAVARLKRTRPDISCLIVGDGPERSSLEDLSIKLGLVGNVSFTGFVPQNTDVFGYMKASKVFVSPSTREGFGLTVLEANACGLPVVTVDDAANAAKDLVTAANGTVTGLSPAALAKAIAALLDVPLTRRSVASTTGRYDWDASALAIEQVYQS